MFSVVGALPQELPATCLLDEEVEVEAVGLLELDKACTA
jgi:hypothetical protein